MAKTTTAVNACNAAMALDSAAGAATSITGSSNKVSIALTQELGEYVVFQDKWKSRLECSKDVTYTLQVVYSTTADEGFDLLRDWFYTASPGARTLTVYIPDKNVGSDRYQGEVRLASLTWDTDRGEAGPILATAELVADGTQTHSMAAT